MIDLRAESKAQIRLVPAEAHCHANRRTPYQLLDRVDGWVEGWRRVQVHTVEIDAARIHAVVSSHHAICPRH